MQMPPLAPMGDGAGFGDPAAPAAPTPGPNPLLLLALGGAVAWAHWKFKSPTHDEAPEEDDDADDAERDEEDEDEDEPEFSRPPPRRRKPRRLSDVTTDALLDEPALLASRGKKGDCYKAVKLLKGRAGLVSSARERSLYSKVARKVSDDCAHADEEVEQAIDEENALHDEVEDILGTRSPRGAIHEPGMRKAKVGRTTEKTTVEHGDARSKGRGRAGRPAKNVAIQVRKKSGETYRIRKEKAKTKRGYTWRKED